MKISMTARRWSTELNNAAVTLVSRLRVLGALQKPILAWIFSICEEYKWFLIVRIYIQIQVMNLLVSR